MLSSKCLASDQAALSYATLADLCGSRNGTFNVACPLCGPNRHSIRNRTRTVLRIWHDVFGFASFCCARCGERGWAQGSGAQTIRPAKLKQLRKEAAKRDHDHDARQRDKARWLWSKRQPVQGTPVEHYLRWRGHERPIPATIGFLPARSDYPPALIAAFAMASETMPGFLSVDDQSVPGIALIRLTNDGRKADIEPVKIMLGPSLGTPIVLSPMNDQLGLIICEGIETGLSLFDATGCGVWAAGSASRMPALADVILPHVDCVTIAAEPDEAGQKYSGKLAVMLERRGIYLEMRVFGAGEAQAA